MTVYFTIGLFITFCCTATPGLLSAAEMATSTTVATPGLPKFAQMGFLIGKWSCQYRSSRRPTPWKATVTYQLSPRRHWLTETSINFPSPWAPWQRVITSNITYDGSSGRWVDVSLVDNGSYSVSTSSGWQTNAILWQDMNLSHSGDLAKSNSYRVTRISDNELTESWSFLSSARKVVKISGTCKKVAFGS